MVGEWAFLVGQLINLFMLYGGNGSDKPVLTHKRPYGLNYFSRGS